MRSLIKPFAAFIFLLAAFTCGAQHVDRVLMINAARNAQTIDPKTGKASEFFLCGDDVYTDSARFFCMISGCERNVAALIGKYTLANDTIIVSPFDFLLEDQFLMVRKDSANCPTQTIQFLSATYEQLRGHDSSWVVRCFKGRKTVVRDFSATGIVTLTRGKYKAVELVQLKKIFHTPVVMFPDSHFDYTIVVNLPTTLLTRFLTGASAIHGKGFITADSLYFNMPSRGFKVWYNSAQKKQ